ncbi:protein CexE (CfaD-dependent expression extracytoplasmicprotein) [Escherichia coli TA280]|nr:protein CexE (CfaD-dependent expression extracytoplasmicprotein) [Escherichia coli TA280]
MCASFSAVAGGGGASWQPSVTPGQCVLNVPAPGVTLKWNNTQACNEVISRGYAASVYVSGLFIYEGGQITRRYSGNVAPGHDHYFSEPKEIDGKKFSSLGQTNYQWVTIN